MRDIERSNRTAPQSHFNGGYVGHGPLVSDLPPLRPLRVLWTGALAIIVFGAWAYWFAGVTS